MTKIFSVLFFISLLSISCQKESSLENGLTPNPVPIPTVNDSVYLSKIIDFDTTKPALFDTVLISNFTYDNLKRLVSQNYINFINGIRSVSPFDSYELFYNGLDSLPYKTIQKSEELPNRFIYTSFYTYLPGTAKLLTDSGIGHRVLPVTSDSGFTISSYTYGVNSVTEISRSYNNLNSYYGRDTGTYFNIVKLNGCITSQQYKSSIKQPYNAPINSTLTCTYDISNNPFAKIFREDIGFIRYNDLRPGVNDFNRRNNRLTMYYQSTAGSLIEIGSAVNRYKYNNKNFPTEVTAIDYNAGTVFNSSKSKYFYTN